MELHTAATPYDIIAREFLFGKKVFDGRSSRVFCVTVISTWSWELSGRRLGRSCIRTENL